MTDKPYRVTYWHLGTNVFYEVHSRAKATHVRVEQFKVEPFKGHLTHTKEFAVADGMVAVEAYCTALDWAYEAGKNARTQEIKALLRTVGLE